MLLREAFFLMASSPSQGTIVGSCGGSGKNSMAMATTAMGRAEERKIRWWDVLAVRVRGM